VGTVTSTSPYSPLGPPYGLWCAWPYPRGLPIGGIASNAVLTLQGVARSCPVFPNYSSHMVQSAIRQHSSKVADTDSNSTLSA
jgi:hypothetical protein